MESYGKTILLHFMTVLWRPAMVGANNMLGTSNVKRRRIVQVWSSGTGTGVQFGSKPSRPSRKIALHLLLVLFLLLLQIIFLFSSSTPPFRFYPPSPAHHLTPYPLLPPFTSPPPSISPFLTTNPSPNSEPSVPVVSL